MRALLRFALIKTLRERSLIALLAGPLVLIGSPMVSLHVVAQMPGHHFRIDEPARLAFAVASATGAIAMAGAAAFWIFRREIADRSLGIVFLASRDAIRVCATGVLFACMVAVASYIPMAGLLLAFGVGASDVASASRLLMKGSPLAATLGIFIASISTSVGNLLLVTLLAIPILSLVVQARAASFYTTLAIVALVLIPISSRLMERRCGS